MERHGLDETQFTLTEHLTELRTRLLRSVGGIMLTMVGCLYFSPQILDYSIAPLLAVLADRNRVETVVVETEGGELGGLLRKNPKVRLQSSFTSLLDAASMVKSAALGRHPIDLVVVSGTALPEDGTLLLDHVDTLQSPPEVGYVLSKQDPRYEELKDEGLEVLPLAPRPARIGRLVRSAASLAGKSAKGDRLVVLSPLEPFFAYVKVALVCGLFLACPIWLFQVWAFVAPGLYAHERNFALPVVLSGSVLFVGGGLFAYYAMFPLMFDVLVNQMMPDTLAGSFTVDKYLGLLLRVTVAFGVVFELPLAIALLSALGLVQPKQLRSWRKYAYVLSTVLGALLTPADPISQLMMALPLVFFYEVGIIMASIFGRKPSEETALVPKP